MKYIIIINLVPIAAGGGLQNALSFLQQLPTVPELCDRAQVVCVHGSAIHQSCRVLGLDYVAVKGGVFGRLAYELWLGRRIVRASRARLVFSLFGNAPINSGPVHRISGFAYSNIIQPEIPFWDFLRVHRRIFTKFKDKGRLWLARRADEIILETDYLRARSEVGVFARKLLHVVRMEPSVLVLEARTNQVSRMRASNEPFDILYLSGAHPNKRIHLLAPILCGLRERCAADGRALFRLVITLPESAPYTFQIQDAFAKHNALDLLKNIGPVRPHDVGALLSQVNAIVNISLLESFSNNWVEAWAFGLPLITTDADWARASCGSSAIYIDPTKPAEAVELLYGSLTSERRLRELADAGYRQLEDLSRDGKKIDQYARILLESGSRLEVVK
jgi:glycosyltransferase involved in cell wall biosynthesis